MSKFLFTFFTFTVLTAGSIYSAVPSSDRQEELYGYKRGYVTDVGAERNTRILEVTPVLNPDRPVNYNRLIFRPKLENEIKAQYESQFGKSAIERSYAIETLYTSDASSYGIVYTEKEQVENQNLFGQYVIKRLAEDHFDQFTKTNPTLKPVYELKERISNYKVEVRKGYQLTINYSLSGNFINLKLTNPYDIDAKLTLQMDPQIFGPGEIQSESLSLGYSVNKKVRVDSSFGLTQQSYTITGSQKLSKILTASITTSSIVRDQENPDDREKLILLGLAWTY